MVYLNIEKLLEKNNYQLNTENTNDFIWVLDSKTLKYDFVAGAFYEITGYSLEEFKQGEGISLIDITDPETYIALVTEIKEHRNNCHYRDANESKQGSFSIIRKNGETVWIEFDAKFVKHNSGVFFDKIVGVYRRRLPTVEFV
jgi:PAS domain S-box-containing protein